MKTQHLPRLVASHATVFKWVMVTTIAVMFFIQSYGQTTSGVSLNERVRLKIDYSNSGNTIVIDTNFESSRLYEVKKYLQEKYPDLNLFSEDDTMKSKSDKVIVKCLDMDGGTVMSFDIRSTDEDMERIKEELKEICILICKDSSVGGKSDHHCIMTWSDDDFEKEFDGDAKIIIIESDVSEDKDRNVEIRKGKNVVIINGDNKEVVTIDKVDSLVGSTHDMLVPEKFDLFPNPASDKITLTFQLKDKDSVEVLISDITGGVVFEEQLANFNGRYSREIKLGEENGGVYVASIHQNGKIYSKKFMIE
jgi:hypothetical protein